GIATRFIELAGEVNVAMPRYVVGKVQDALNDRGKALKGAKILLLGMAYKKDIDDPRESPSFELLHLLESRGAEVDYHDPHIPHLPSMRSWPELAPRDSVPLEASTIDGYDVVLIATDHSDVDYEMVAKRARVVVDTRGVFRAALDNVVKA
ncbi:MAG: UDP binding domain-containing protein, partial [Polyangiaceae bacterium]